jgi:arabinogalactan oligomer / maltooligosaccharide transport system permease protein
MFTDLGRIVPALGLNSILGYSVAMLGGSLGQVWLIKGTLDTIPRSLDEAAIIDGASHWQVFRAILVPILKPILATTFLLAFVGVISEFLIGSLFLTDAGSKTLAVGLYGLLENDRSSNLGVFAAASVLTMIPVIALFQYLQRYIVGDASAGAVKG